MVDRMSRVAVRVEVGEVGHKSMVIVVVHFRRAMSPRTDLRVANVNYFAARRAVGGGVVGVMVVWANL